MRLIIIYFIFFLALKPIYSNNIALPCLGCHNSNSNISENTIPNIIGLDNEYFINAFYDYKNKIRDNYIMQIIAQGYSDMQINKLAEYFNNIKNIKNDK